MPRRVLWRAELGGAFQCDIYILPAELCRISLCRDADRAAARIHGSWSQCDRMGQAAMDRVKLKEMCVGLQRGQIIDGDHFDPFTRAVQRSP